MSDQTTTTEPTGQADQAPPDDHHAPNGDSPPAPDNTDGLKRALADERKKSARAERELAELRKAHMSEAEKAVAEAKAEGRKAALAEVSSRLLAAEVRAVAADRMADPADAIHLLDLDGLVDEDGNVDRKAMVTRIEDLLRDKPYLAKGGKPAVGKAPQGARDDGSSGDKMSGDAFIRRAVNRRRHT